MNEINIFDKKWLESGKIKTDVHGDKNIIEVKERKVIQNKILNPFPAAKMNNELNVSIKGTNNKVMIGSILIDGRLSINISGDNNTVIIGDNNFIKRNLSLNIRPAGPNIRLKEAKVEIGEENWFNGNVVLDAGESNKNIKIGSYNLFANNISLSTSDNHCIFNLDDGKILNKAGSVEVEDHVWICTDVLVLNNTKISKNSVIAARSVVTKKFEQGNVVIGGVPGKVIKSNISWSQNLYENTQFLSQSEIKKWIC